MADMAQNDGGQAFPTPMQFNEQAGFSPEKPGMSLRDYFAAKALPFVMADMSRRDIPEYLLPKEWATASYEVADAMLKARNA